MPQKTIQMTDQGGGDLVVTHDNALPIHIAAPNAAFGEMLTATNHPLWGADFVYSLLAQVHDNVTQAGGTADTSDSLGRVRSGTSNGGLARITSTRSLRYTPGIGAMCRFTAMFTTPTANSSQQVGLSNIEDSMFIGYRLTSSDFSITKLRGGKMHVVSFQVTTASSTAENITVELNGVDTTVAVTNNSNVNTTAWEISQGDYSGVSNIGFTARAIGDTVYFIYQASASASGSYSITASTAVVSVTTERSGSAASVASTTQANFNIDKLDGTGPSGMTLDPTKLNVFELKFQYLGAGAMEFNIENPNNGRFFTFHRIKFAGSNTITSLSNPSMKFHMEVVAGASSNDVTLSSGSAGIFLQGDPLEVGVNNSAETIKTGVGTSLTPVLSIGGKNFFKSRTAFAESVLKNVSVSVDGSKPAIIHIIINGTLTAANFAEVNSDSVVSFDTAATAISGGYHSRVFTLPKAGGSYIDMVNGEFWFDRARIITFAVEATSGTTDVAVSATWLERV